MHVPAKISFKTSTIADGNMSVRFGEAKDVIRNRETFLKNLNIPVNRYITMQCNHGDVIEFVDTPSREPIDAEVLVTKTPALTLLLLTADCLPTAFYDPLTSTIALAHFSRQTIAAGLPQKTVGWLQQQLQVNPTNLQVFVGPHIQPQSYCFNNTNEQFADPIEPFVKRQTDSVCVDLPAAHTAQLVSAGVRETNIQYSDIDTFSSPEHFSHFESTRDDQKPHGRLATILTLLPAGSGE